MIQLTARIFQDGQLIGYQATDGQQTRNITKQEAWAYAKQRIVFNVTASGTLQDPVLSGTNGFQLKNLPELKVRATRPELSMNIVLSDYHAALIRGFILNPLIENKTGDTFELSKKLFEHDVTSGLIQEDFQSMRGDLQLVNYIIQYEDCAPINEKTGNKMGGEKVGVVLKNISNKTIIFNRVLSEYVIVTDETIDILPGKEVYLSNLEAAVLLSRPQFSGKISNAELVNFQKIWESPSKYVRHFDIQGDIQGRAGRVLTKKIDVIDIASKDEIEKYYRVYNPTIIELQTDDLQMQSPKTDIQHQINNNTSGGITGLFNRFSRK